MSKKPPPTYDERKAKALQDLALNVLADPSASPEDVERAMAHLTAPPPPTSEQIAASSQRDRRAALALADALDDPLKRERIIEMLLQSIDAEPA